MEKIQNAIAKARAEREGTAGPLAAQTLAARAPGQPGQAQPRNVDEAQKPAPTFRARAASAASLQEIDEAWANLPALNYSAKLMRKNRIVTLEGGKEARGIDMMRTRVLQQMRDNGWRRLAITSPTASCGKSTISLNLALSMQRQPDMRTMLLELDLRRPALIKMIGTDQDISYAGVLEGSRSFEENALRYSSNLIISANKRPSRDAAELLASRHVPVALEEVEARYNPDITIFDTPPMLATDDMMAFARHVDCVLLVAGSESTTIKEVDICEQELASQTNVMGVVLNKCRYMGPEYDYDYS
jgi:Mrp family chromosome partitioning ATPase